MSSSSRRSRRGPSDPRSNARDASGAASGGGSRNGPPGARRAGAREGPGGGRVRIIGGRWRGRRLPVVDVAGLRPSGDRLRETLFNWLQPYVPGARCLDLFAGSGVLGLEAMSRGAAGVVLVERDARAADSLRQTLVTLDATERVRLVRGTAERFLARDTTPFDIVFVDPPFDAACQRETLAALADGHLACGALVHVEAPSRQAPAETVLPDGFEIVRERTFGDVTARLLRTIDRGGPRVP